MNPNTRFVAVALSAILALSVIAPGLAVADTASDNGTLNINVSQHDEVVATVTDDNGSVENATVNVTVDDENATYEGAGTYATDENGTVGLPTPEETVNVTIGAAYENRTAETSVTLAAAEDGDDGATDEPFGYRVTAFVHALLNGDADGDDNRSVGERVAGFVTSNNPGNAPDHAGPGNSSEPSSDDDTDERPESSTPSADDERSGPPTHAGPDGDAGSNETAADDAADGDDGSSTEREDTGGSSNDAPESDDGSSGASGNSGGSNGASGNSGNGPRNGAPDR